MIHYNKILVKQRKTVAKFVIDNYFPISNNTINLTNKSIESDSNLWVLNNGNTIITGATVNSSLNILTTNPLNEILRTTNGVSDSSYNRWIYPIFPPTRVYSEIVVSSECIRIGEPMTISANDLNEVGGAIVSYLFTIKNSSGGVDKILTNKFNTGVTFNRLGYFDVVLEVTTNGSTVKQTLEKLITVTPALPNISGATIVELTPRTSGYQSFGNNTIPAGTTIVLRLPPSPSSGSTYRFSCNNLVGTAQNPIVVTVDGVTPLNINFFSYWGLQFYNCHHVIFDGKGYHNLEYGFNISKYDTTDEASVGIAVGYLCSDIQLFGIEVSKCTFAGIQAKSDPNPNNPEVWRGNYTFYNFHMHHCYFHDTSCEGNYLGYFSCGTHTGINTSGQTVTYRAHELRDVKVYRNNYYRCGWDSIQLNNATGDSEICYNLLIDSAYFPEIDQASFMSVTMDGSIHDNIMINSGGVGIQFGTFYGINIYNNVMTGVSQAYSSLMLLNGTDVPEQYGINGLNTGSTINIYNNTCINNGIFLNARNVVQYFDVHVKNNLVRYKGAMFTGQADSTLLVWNANASNNSILSDSGTTYEMANIDDNDFRISSNSSLTKAGVLFNTNNDVRGYENWYDTTKHVGAYSGYRRLSNSTIILNNFIINSGATTTNTKIVTLSYAETGTATKYMVSELPTLSGASWINITGSTIHYTLSEPDGLKTLYFRLQNSEGMSSGILSDNITLDRVKRFKIDFGADTAAYKTGPTGAPPTTNEKWNNMFSPGNVNPIATGNTITLSATTFTSSPYTAVITTSFSQYQTQGASNLTGSTTLYPYSAYRDSFSSLYGTYGIITLKHLNPLYTYTIKCYGSRNSSTNRTIYTVNGNSQPLLTLNNYLNTADFLNVVPNINNEISVRVEGTTGYSDTKGILSVLEIIEYA